MVSNRFSTVPENEILINGDRDVPLVVEMLEANAFTDITTLVNSEATKAAIVKAITEPDSASQEGRHRVHPVLGTRPARDGREWRRS